MKKLSARREGMASGRLKLTRAKSTPAGLPAFVFLFCSLERAFPGATLPPLASKRAATQPRSPTPVPSATCVPHLDGGLQFYLRCFMENRLARVGKWDLGSRDGKE